MLNHLSITHLIHFVLKIFSSLGFPRTSPVRASTDPDAPKRQPRAIL